VRLPWPFGRSTSAGGASSEPGDGVGSGWEPQWRLVQGSEADQRLGHVSWILHRPA